MGKKITLRIGGRVFGIDDLDDDFADYLKKSMSKDFLLEGNNDIKMIFQGYAKRVHELYLQDKKLQEMMDKLEDKI